MNDRLRKAIEQTMTAILEVHCEIPDEHKGCPLCEAYLDLQFEAYLGEVDEAIKKRNTEDTP